MSEGPTGGPSAFYRDRIPAQFNRALDEQEAAGESGASVLADMRSVNATMKVIVDADDGGTFFLNIDAGRMTSDEAPRRDPFLTLLHDRATWARLAAEAGDSALGFLGGLAGLAGEIKLTQTRIDNLAEVAGAVRFDLTGEGGFSLLTHFGAGAVPDEPACTISVDMQAYRDLRSGELNPQEAFMGGQISVEGDLQLAMQLALAAMSPD